MSAELRDETAVVTGAGRGIGRAVALKLAAAGARVLAVDVDGEGLAETARLAAHQSLEVAIEVEDVASASGPERIVSQALAVLRSIRILVNNAGIGGSHRAGETSDEEFDRFIAVDLRSVFRLSRDTVAHMPATGGAIINVASIYGMTGFPGSSSYAAAKAGVIGLTRQMAADYGPFGIRVNAVSPGLIDTAMTRRRMETSAWFRSQMIEATPLRRHGQPDEIARVVAFLASSDASFITGEVLVVDGGWLSTRYRDGLDNLALDPPPVS